MGTTRSIQSREIDAPVEKVFDFVARAEAMFTIMGNAELGEL